MFIFLSFIVKHDQEWFLSYSRLRLNTLSFSLISLSVFIKMVMLISRISNINIKIHSIYFIFLLISLLLCLVLTFRTSNIILFYVIFEASLIPTFILILGWGNQPERFQAGIYIIIYTVIASLPLLVVFLIWSIKIGRTSIHILCLYNSNWVTSGLWAFFSYLCFLSKTTYLLSSFMTP